MEPVRARKETGSPVGNGVCRLFPPFFFLNPPWILFFFFPSDLRTMVPQIIVQRGLVWVLSEEVEKSSYKVLKEQGEGPQQVSRASP